MYRIWAVLLLALSLWPTPAAADTGVQAGGHGSTTVLAVQPEPGHDAVRASSGFQRLERVEALRTDLRSRVSGSGPGHLPAALRVEIRAVAEPGLRPPTVAPVPEHCERLPYHATAPPSRR